MKIYDAFYFIVLTVTTVGYGDVYPKTSWGKFVTCFFVFAGLALLAEALNIVQDYLLERMNKINKKLAREAALKEREAAEKAAQEVSGRRGGGVIVNVSVIVNFITKLQYSASLDGEWCGN